MSKMPAITISDWLKTASSQLKLAGISSYNLDAELILSNLYQKDRTYLHANSEQIISTDICETAKRRSHPDLRRGFVPELCK